jgi:hypothetical protein
LENKRTKTQPQARRLNKSSSKSRSRSKNRKIQNSKIHLKNEKNGNQRKRANKGKKNQGEKSLENSNVMFEDTIKKLESILRSKPSLQKELYDFITIEDEADFSDFTESEHEELTSEDEDQEVATTGRFPSVRNSKNFSQNFNDDCVKYMTTRTGRAVKGNIKRKRIIRSSSKKMKKKNFQRQNKNRLVKNNNQNCSENGQSTTKSQQFFIENLKMSLLKFMDEMGTTQYNENTTPQKYLSPQKKYQKPKSLPFKTQKNSKKIPAKSKKSKVVDYRRGSILNNPSYFNDTDVTSDLKHLIRNTKKPFRGSENASKNFTNASESLILYDTNCFQTDSKFQTGYTEQANRSRERNRNRSRSRKFRVRHFSLIN